MHNLHAQQIGASNEKPQNTASGTFFRMYSIECVQQQENAFREQFWDALCLSRKSFNRVASIFFCPSLMPNSLHCPHHISAPQSAVHRRCSLPRLMISAYRSECVFILPTILSASLPHLSGNILRFRPLRAECML